MEKTELDFSVLESLDFEPVCEYYNPQGNNPECGNPATMVLWTNHYSCACYGVVERLFCDKSLAERNRTGQVICIKCLAPADAHATIIRIERIK